MLGCAISEGYAQKVALKSNLLYDATTTMNLGLEIGLARKWTLDIPVNYNPWKLSDGKRQSDLQPQIHGRSSVIQQIAFQRNLLGMTLGNGTSEHE